LSFVLRPSSPTQVVSYRNQRVKLGDVAVDVDSGTGTVSHLTCPAGAGHVCAVELGPMVSKVEQTI
jgi:hypothetical protein